MTADNLASRFTRADARLRDSLTNERGRKKPHVDPVATMAAKAMQSPDLPMGSKLVA